MKCNASLGRTRLTGHYGVNKLLMTEILFGTPNSKTKGSLGLLLKIPTENPIVVYPLSKKSTNNPPK